MANIRPIAIYLPQFHPIKENDEWWGKGFTEWTNVTKARPLYKGHLQPDLPADLGFYDLRLPEIMEQQTKMAADYGIHGFCFYHYWFTGKRLLEKPVDMLLKNKSIDFPFMLCWANENWTRRWDGLDNEVLMEQVYSIEDDTRHIEHLIPYFQDERYIRVGNKAVFIVYKHFLLPNATQTANRWREIASRHGVELYLCHMALGYRDDNKVVEGFDAAIDFEPFGVRHPEVFKCIHDRLKLEREKLKNRTIDKINSLFNWRIEKSVFARYNMLNYDFYQQHLVPLKEIDFKLYPSVVPGWDNSPRKPGGPTLILANNTPELFESWVRKVKDDFEPYSKDENFFFINAWNEWAEGNHLEPGRLHGFKYLEALKSGMS